MNVGGSDGERAVRELPVNGRNFLDYATLTHGVVRDPRAGDLSFGDQRGTLDRVQIDVVDNSAQWSLGFELFRQVARGRSRNHHAIINGYHYTVGGLAPPDSKKLSPATLTQRALFLTPHEA